MTLKDMVLDYERHLILAALAASEPGRAGGWVFGPLPAHPPRAGCPRRPLGAVGQREQLLGVAFDPRLAHLLQPLRRRLEEGVDDPPPQLAPPLPLEHAQR